MKNSIKLLALLSLFFHVMVSCAKIQDVAVANVSTSAQVNSSSYEVALAGNAFVTSRPTGASEIINNAGLANWNNAATIISIYFRVEHAGDVQLKLKAKVAPANNSSKIRVAIGNTAREIDLAGADFKDYDLGTFTVQAGYVKVDLQGISKTGGYFADVSHLLVSGAASANLLYANDPAYYYWARRGPSSHMQYTIPTNEPVQYYYGEMTVPVGEDAIGSYFMSNGFSEGYFGIQVNSSTERRILFSVWSPYSTDNPNEIPESQRITLNKKGQDVYTGEFGNEGSGGQSYLRYNWTAGTTYKFLLKGQPDGTGSTDFSAWVYLEDKGGWFLIASFKRPQLSKYLTGFYSFLENFNPNEGYIDRKVNFTNRWVRTAAGNWLPVNAARFTVDATYNARQRIDAIGGVENNKFYLRMGSFFSTVVAPNSNFSVQAPTVAPVIDFNSLP
ncbi:DUF3472 domain-containing protein [Sphingobacterium oryzagri]|uniref:DUF3472 domain-containing protein n=1 Tax=Sphingobacterium oryzagri TaxID=3025669 RepID=A0ABY7WIW8_9SPHI|nr:DUF3472 domain-containing protein [Sphingobacterium sp. KACC 22765]WDF69455.1 DUF3472 domain-containing protein [Sphingobacterium sp. KACC 22765]